MSDTFDPGNGWRRSLEPVERKGEVVAVYPADGGPAEWWVREAPVPPLPTTPYTVIRVTWHDGGNSVLARQDGVLDEWTWVNTQHHATTAEVHQQGVESFAVLSEPCAVTAKAVLAEAIQEHAISEYSWARRTALKFGVKP